METDRASPDLLRDAEAGSGKFAVAVTAPGARGIRRIQPHGCCQARQRIGQVERKVNHAQVPAAGTRTVRRAVRASGAVA